MFGGRDEASLVNGKAGEEEKGGHGTPRGDLYKEESFYTRDELTREKDTHTHRPTRDELTHGKDTQPHGPTRE